MRTCPRIGPVVVLLLAPLAVSCSQPPAAPELPADSAPGMTLGRVTARMPEAATLVVQDLSLPLAHVRPSYDASQEHSADWTVLATCADAETVERASKVEVAVVPATTVSAEMRAKISSGGFAGTLDCRDVH